MVQIRATTFLQKSFNYLRRFSWEYAAWLTIEVFSSLPNLHFEVKNALYNLKNATEFLKLPAIAGRWWNKKKIPADVVVCIQRSRSWTLVTSVSTLAALTCSLSCLTFELRRLRSYLTRVHARCARVTLVPLAYPRAHQRLTHEFLFCQTSALTAVIACCYRCISSVATPVTRPFLNYSACCLTNSAWSYLAYHAHHGR